MSIGRVKKHYPGRGMPWLLALKVSVFAGFMFLCFIAVNKVKNIDYFPIHNVKIFGVQHIEHDNLQQLVSPFVNNGFFAVDVDKIKENMLRLPWVSQAVVRRVWPDIVVVAISEKKPVALWNSNSLLSSAGELFSPNLKSYPNGLPEFIGPAGEQILMAQYYAKMSSVLTALHCKIMRLELTPAMAWNITLNNGTKLSIGHKDILTRLNHFVKVYPKVVGDHLSNVEYIDLRYPNGMAVKWKTIT